MLSSLVFLLAVSAAVAFRGSFVRPQRAVSSVQLHPTDFHDAFSLLTAVVAEEKPDGYVYGAVAAPSWALPVGAVLAVLTAALPFLLKPGEDALEQQRENESITNSQFNKRKGKDLR